MSQAPTTTTGQRTPDQAANALFNDVKNTAGAIERGDWLTAGIGVTNVAMDIIGLGGDPLGSISSAGFGWLIGHIKFLREPFDKLLGDPGSIVSSANGWANASNQLTQNAQQYRDAVARQTTSWTGNAAAAYRTASDAQARNLDSLSQISKAVSEAIAGAGKALAEVRKAVIDIINQACNRIIMIIIEALAAAWGSFGASIAKGIAQSVQTAVQSAQKMLSKVQKLIQTLQKVMQLIQKVMQLANAVKRILELIGGKANGGAPSTPQAMTGTAMNYGGTVAANTGPAGTATGNVPLTPASTGPDYSYNAYTPGGSGDVALTPASTGPNYNYDAYQPGGSGTVQPTPGAGAGPAYNYQAYQGGGSGTVQPTQGAGSGPAYNYQAYQGSGAGNPQLTHPSGTGPAYNYAAYTGSGGGSQPAQSGGTGTVPPVSAAPQTRGAAPGGAQVTPVQAQAPAPPPATRQAVPQPPRSQNGWPVNPPRTARTVPGTNIRITVADGPAGDVLMFVATQFHQQIEPLDQATTGGYNARTIGGGNVWSNHASATAIDFNWGNHAQGLHGTFTADQVARIREILYDAGGVVRWGGDYRGTPDEMHFEINGTPEQVQRAAERVRLIQERTP